MQARNGADAWSPVDYAPHLWREFQARLLGYELRYRAGAAFDAKELAAELKANILPVKVLLEQGSPPPDTDRLTVVFRLAQARRQFLDSDAKASFDQEHGEVDAIREAIQLKNDLLFWAPDYLRWHARANLGAVRTVPLYGPISELLEQLPGLLGQLESLEALDTGRGSPRADLQAALKEVRARKQNLEKLREQVEQDGLEREARQLLDDLAQDPSQKGVATRIDHLLRTPLLPAPLRKELLDALEGLGVSSLEVTAAARSQADVSPIATWQWERLAERADLQVLIVRGIDPESAARLDEFLQDAWRPSSSRDGQAEPKL